MSTPNCKGQCQENNLPCSGKYLVGDCPGGNNIQVWKFNLLYFFIIIYLFIYLFIFILFYYYYYSNILVLYE